MTSPIRPHKVLELKAILEEYTGYSKIDKLFFVFFGRDKIVDGFTMSELVVAFFPNGVITINGKQLILSWAFKRVQRLLTRLRGMYKTGQVPFAQFEATSRSHILYNNQTNTEPQLKKRMTNVQTGADKNLKILLKTMGLTPKQRKMIQEEMKKAIIIKRKRKSKK